MRRSAAPSQRAGKRPCVGPGGSTLGFRPVMMPSQAMMGASSAAAPIADAIGSDGALADADLNISESAQQQNTNNNHAAGSHMQAKAKAGMRDIKPRQSVRQHADAADALPDQDSESAAENLAPTQQQSPTASAAPGVAPIQPKPRPPPVRFNAPLVRPAPTSAATGASHKGAGGSGGSSVNAAAAGKGSGSGSGDSIPPRYFKVCISQFIFGMFLRLLGRCEYSSALYAAPLLVVSCVWCVCVCV